MRVIVTGATGMVGEGVLHECLLSPLVESVLIVNRKSAGITHPKLKEIIHQDFFDLLPINDQLAGYNACFFCLGVSSVGMKEDEYFKKTYTLTMHFAETVSSVNKDMVFDYVSGAGTDSTEKGGTMWARVKGKTENDLAKLPFKKVYAYRPGVMKATEGAKNQPKLYKYLGWLYPIIAAIAPGSACTLKEVGLSMINLMYVDYPTHIITPNDIKQLAKEKV
ncbi:epimerase [Mucilaginibacter ginkgonis]|uniref:Epimerase n=1 Tax=Mucilaginibacter ginkgonis TaxID=2682091 RepID=A0A7T7FDX8_9SPHI|nr:epimerase [Mucilaginibacter ginkgonis]